MLATWVPISSVALAVCEASCFTSDATTAKPRPASPARAASMVALSARRLVCSAMAVISATTSPMRVAACDSWLMRLSVLLACATASLAIRLDSCTCRAISLTELDISSVAQATDWTLAEACSEAAVTVMVSCCVVCAVWVSAPEARLRVRLKPAIPVRRWRRPRPRTDRRARCIAALRCAARAFILVAPVSRAVCARSAALILNVVDRDGAIAPISSLRSSPGKHDIEIAVGEFAHRARHRLERPRHRAADEEGDQRHEENDQRDRDLHAQARGLERFSFSGRHVVEARLHLLDHRLDHRLDRGVRLLRRTLRAAELHWPLPSRR